MPFEAFQRLDSDGKKEARTRPQRVHHAVAGQPVSSWGRTTGFHPKRSSAIPFRKRSETGSQRIGRMISNPHYADQLTLRAAGLGSANARWELREKYVGDCRAANAAVW